MAMRVDVQKPKRYLNEQSTIFRVGVRDTFICDFEKVFTSIEKKNINVFYIPRKAFYTKGDLICNTINIFMKYYDTDNEFITCYLNMKVLADLSNMTYTFTTFLSDLVNRLFSESMVKKIQEFVEEQYRVDLEASVDRDKYKDNPYQFTNKHGKILMAISTAIKLSIPIVCHYYAVRNDQLSHDMMLKRFVYQCFYALFPLFEGDTQMYNKLYATVDKAVSNSEYSDSGMWKRSKNKGITPTVEKNRITKMIIQDLLYKYEFDGIIIHLNHASIRYTLGNTLGGKDTHDYSDINMKSSDSKMSGLEQLEMNAARIDERDILIASHGSRNKVKKLMEKYNVKDDRDVLKFYIDNCELSQIQFQIITQFFADDFRGTENMRFILRDDFYRLLIIMKHELRRRGFTLIPYLISGNQSNKIKGRKMNFKKLNKIKSIPRYYNLAKQYRDVSKTINDEFVTKYISVFINNPLTYVDHKEPELLGVDITVNENIVIDETIRLIEMF